MTDVSEERTASTIRAMNALIALMMEELHPRRL
jgi:hypothetical protein